MDMSPEDWNAVAEIEGILNVTAFATTISQSEKKMIRAYRIFVKQQVLNELRKGCVEVYELDSSENSFGLHSEAKRVQRTASELTDIGRQTLKRAQLEAERRWTGNIDL